MGDLDGESVQLQVLPKPPSAGGKIEAIAAVEGKEATFVAFVSGIGLRYLDLDAEGGGRWSTAGGFAGAISGQFGVFHHSGGGGPAAFVSFVEAPARSWVCLRVPQVGEAMSVDQAALVERTALGAAVAAACRAAPADGEAALLLAGGAVRFLDLCSGKVVGKGPKLEGKAASSGSSSMAIAGLGPRRVAVVWEAEYFVLELEAETQKVLLRSQGSLGLGGLGSLGSLMGASSMGPREDRLLLCWGGASEASARTFATVLLEGATASASPLPSTAAPSAAWMCVSGYLAECVPVEGQSDLTVALRDARFGMQVASAEVPLALGKKAAGGLLFTASRGTALIVGGKGSEAAALRWRLPRFSLQLLIGADAKEALAQGPAQLSALRELAAGKRPGDDPAVEEMLSGKRRKTTDEALASEVRRRCWPPSHELVDIIVRGQCWAAARELLGLPELGEDLAVRLLAGDAGQEASLLAHVVRRASTPGLLQAALENHLPPALLPALLEVLIEWMEAYREFTPAALQKAAPGLPTQAEIVRFLAAMADGCLPSLLRLEGDLLERVSEALLLAERERARGERTHSTLRAALKIKEGSAFLREAREAPAVEALLLDF
mmetsp:Transcript_30133/g.86257  ORF Transcript_30133/g.86257 Transcript_30133/m.86257 type:complete len:608 (-) Transcript_30133:118-1941(-)